MHLGWSYKMFAIGQEEEALAWPWKENALERRLKALWGGHGTVLGEDLWLVFMIQVIQMVSFMKIDTGSVVIYPEEYGIMESVLHRGSGELGTSPGIGLGEEK